MDDENIYLSIIITTESDNAKKRFEEKWTFVTAETDCRPTRLPDFSEQSGPTFCTSDKSNAVGLLQKNVA